MGVGGRGLSLRLGVMWKSHSLEMESSKEAGKVKRAVELQEEFFVHEDSRGWKTADVWSRQE